MNYTIEALVDGERKEVGVTSALDLRMENVKCSVTARLFLDKLVRLHTGGDRIEILDVRMEEDGEVPSDLAGYYREIVEGIWKRAPQYDVTRLRQHYIVPGDVHARTRPPADPVVCHRCGRPEGKQNPIDANGLCPAHRVVGILTLDEVLTYYTKPDA